MAALRPRIDPPGPKMWPRTVVGGDFEPYVDHEVDQEGRLDPGVLPPKVPIAWGTVQGVPWSLTAFNVDGSGDWGGHGGAEGEPGPAGQLFLGQHGDFGGGGIALFNTTPWRPNDLSVAGMGFGSGPITAHVGVVSRQVYAFELRFDGAPTRRVDLIEGPEGVHARYFVLWAPNELAGTAVALGTDGITIQEKDLCLPARDLSADANAFCQ